MCVLVAHPFGHLVTNLRGRLLGAGEGNSALIRLLRRGHALVGRHFTFKHPWKILCPLFQLRIAYRQVSCLGGLDVPLNFFLFLFVVAVENLEDGLLGVKATQLRVASDDRSHALFLIVVYRLVALWRINLWHAFLFILGHVFVLEANTIAKHSMSQVLVEVEVHFLDRPHILVYVRVGICSPVIEDVYHPAFFL